MKPIHFSARGSVLRRVCTRARTQVALFSLWILRIDGAHFGAHPTPENL